MIESDQRQTHYDNLTEAAAGGDSAALLDNLASIRAAVANIKQHYTTEDSPREALLCSVVADLCAILHAGWRVAENGEADENK